MKGEERNIRARGRRVNKPSRCPNLLGIPRLLGNYGGREEGLVLPLGLLAHDEAHAGCRSLMSSDDVLWGG